MLGTNIRRFKGFGRLTLLVLVLVGTLAGAADAQDLTVRYEGDLQGMKAEMGILFEDLRLPPGSIGWYASSGSIYLAGEVRSAVAAYSFTGNLFDTGVAYCDVVDLTTFDRFRIRLDFPTGSRGIGLQRVRMTVNPFEGLYQTVYDFAVVNAPWEVAPPPPGPGPGPNPVANVPLDVESAGLKVRFGRTGKDGYKLRLRARADGELDGSLAVVDVGGVRREFRLDARGKAKSAFASIRAKASGGYHSFKVKAKRGTFADAWADHGIVDRTTRATVVVPVRIEIGSRVYEGQAQLQYEAKAGKKGSAK